MYADGHLWLSLCGAASLACMGYIVAIIEAYAGPHACVWDCQKLWRMVRLPAYTA